MSFAKQYTRVNVVGKGHISFTVTHTTNIKDKQHRTPRRYVIQL